MPSVLYTLLRGSKILIFLLIFINIFSNILIYVQPLYIGNLVGFFSSNGTIDIQYCIILFLLFVSNSLLNALTNYCSQLLSQRFILKLQLLVGRHIFNLSTSELAKYSNGELASRTISDITVAKNIVSPQVLSLPGTILLILCSTITIIIIDPLLSLTTIFLLALILIISLISGKQIAKLTKSIQQQYSHIGENIQKFASSAIFVKANNLETQSIRNYTLASESLFHSSKKTSPYSSDSVTYIFTCSPILFDYRHIPWKHENSFQRPFISILGRNHYFPAGIGFSPRKLHLIHQQHRFRLSRI